MKEWNLTIRPFHVRRVSDVRLNRGDVSEPATFVRKEGGKIEVKVPLHGDESVDIQIIGHSANSYPAEEIYRASLKAGWGDPYGEEWYQWQKQAEAEGRDIEEISENEIPSHLRLRWALQKQMREDIRRQINQQNPGLKEYLASLPR